MIRITIDGVIHNKPKIVENNGLVACLFSIKSGKDIVSVATEPNAVNILHKGAKVTVKGIYSMKNAIVGATEIFDTCEKSTIRGNTPAELVPQQTTRKPSKDGLFEVPKSARIDPADEKKVAPTKKTQPVSIPAEPIEEAPKKPTVSIPTQPKEDVPVVEEKTDAETGLPMPNFSNFNVSLAGVGNPETDNLPEDVAESKPKVNIAPNASTPKKTTKKGRWSNADFAM